MARHYRPRRSMLYVPGSVPRYLEKARGLKVDALILDLEDPVLPDHKEEARRNVAQALRQGGFGYREIVVRVNALSTPWGRDDLAAVAQAGPHAILFPKIESRQDVLDALAALDEVGAPQMPVMVLIETPLGVLHAEEIAAASERIACLVMGTSDLTNELHARITQERIPMLHALSHCLLAARAHGTAIVDGVHLDLMDMPSFEYACRLARDLGFDGKTLIHPFQIPYANDAFSPRPASLEMARLIIAALAEANAAGRNVAVVDGRLVESLHVEAAKRTLMIHEMIEQMEGEEP
ncbi:MAG: CoA ester lyase [Sulfuricellaceae bacterium]|jgi:citrate lyase subunit beta/citryl-CoA lyase